MEIIREHKVDELIGDLKTNKFKIGEDSMGIIIDSLINLYSDPIGSIVREVTSNCYDAHREKNLKIKHVIPMEKDDDPKWFHPISKKPEIEFQEENILVGVGNAFLFRDFGIGLSKERVEQIYTLFGNSTKRDDNLQIGGFGIGAKSPFSYTDTFYIITNYNGKKYSYMLYRGNDAFHMDLLKTLDTPELNQTEVIIPVNDEKSNRDIRNFAKSMELQLMYFTDLTYINIDEGTGRNVRLADLDYEDDDLAISLKLTKSYDFNDIHLMVGRVRYPLNTSLFERDIVPTEQMPCAIKFAIGEIDLVPSREAVRYTDRTKDAIKAKLNKIKATCAEECEKEMNNCDNFISWLTMGNAIMNNQSRYQHNFDSVFSVKSCFAELKNTDTECNLHGIDLSCSPLNNDVLSKRLFRGFTVYKISKESSSSHVGGYKLKKLAVKIEDLIKCPIYYQIQTYVEGKAKKQFSKAKDFYILKELDHSQSHGYKKSFIQIRKNKITEADIKAESELDLWNQNTKVDCRTSGVIHQDFKHMSTLLSNCKTISYDDVEILGESEEGELLGEYESDQQRRRRLGEVFVRSLYFHDQYGDPAHVRFQNYEYKIENLGSFKDEGGIVIYGFSKHNQLLKNLGAICKQSQYQVTSSWEHEECNNKVIIIKTAATLEKQLTEFINVEDLFTMKHDILKNWYTAKMIKERTEEINYFQVFRRFNQDMFYTWRKLHRLHTKSYNELHYLHRSQEENLITLCKTNDCINHNRLRDLKKVEDYGEGLDLLKHLKEVDDDNEETVINSKRLFLDVRAYLHWKGKKTVKFKKIKKKDQLKQV